MSEPPPGIKYISNIGAGQAATYVTTINVAPENIFPGATKNYMALQKQLEPHSLTTFTCICYIYTQKELQKNNFI